MADVFIYKVTKGNTDGFVSWVDCRGVEPPAQLLNHRLTSIVFDAQDGSITAPAGVTIDIVGTVNADCVPTFQTTTTTSTTTSTTSTSTTTLAPQSFSLSYSAASGFAACSAYPTVSTYYSYNGTNLVVGARLFTSTALITTNVAPNGYYSDGTYYYWIEANGFVAQKSLCGSVQPTTSTSTSTTTTLAPTSTTTSTSTTTTTTAGPDCNYNGGSATVPIPTTSTTSTTTAASTTTSTTTSGPTTTSTSTSTTSTSTSTTTSGPTTTSTSSTSTSTTSTTTEPSTTTTTLPSDIIYVYARDIGSTPNVTLYYDDGGGFNGSFSVDSSSCVSRGFITGFTIGSTLTFSTSYGMEGSTSSCPATANGSSYPYLTTSGAQTVYITIDTDNAL